MDPDIHHSKVPSSDYIFIIKKNNYHRAVGGLVVINRGRSVIRSGGMVGRGVMGRSMVDRSMMRSSIRSRGRSVTIGGLSVGRLSIGRGMVRGFMINWSLMTIGRSHMVGRLRCIRSRGWGISIRSWMVRGRVMNRSTAVYSGHSEDCDLK